MISVLAWRFDHVGDCNRYGNCVDHPFFEKPTIEELVRYPERLPNGAAALVYVPHDALSRDGRADDEAQSAFHSLREHAVPLRAAVGEALHRFQRGHVDEAIRILEGALTEFDRVWNFPAAH